MKHIAQASFTNEGGIIDGVALSDIDWTFHSHCLTFRRPEHPPYIETRLNLRTRDGQTTGYYCLHTDLEGAATDDYLVFDPDRRHSSTSSITASFRGDPLVQVFAPYDKKGRRVPAYLLESGLEVNISSVP